MTHQLRDIQCSQDVGRMAELGKFDQEFTVYGCAYRSEGETYCRISERAETIYRYCKTSALHSLYTTSIMSCSQITAVPAGSQDAIWQEVTYQLAKQLITTYDDAYLELMDRLYARPANNTALPILQQCQSFLEGRFQRDDLQLFENLTDYCYMSKRLLPQDHQRLKQWLANNWRQMEDDVLLKDIYERTFYGLAYRQDQHLIYQYDAQYAAIYRQRQRLLAQGRTVTPIFYRTYWFRSFRELADVKKRFSALLEQLMPPYVSLLETLCKLPSFIPPEEFAAISQNVCQHYSPEAAQDLTLHGYLWNCLT